MCVCVCVCVCEGVRFTLFTRPKIFLQKQNEKPPEENKIMFTLPKKIPLY